MAEFDFKDVGVILGLIAGGLGTFGSVFARPQQPARDLRDALESARQPGEIWVRSQRRQLLKILVSPLYLGLALFYLIILTALVYLVWAGPENVLDPASWGTLAEPLKLGEQVVYALLILPVAVLYVWKVLSPMWTGWKAVLGACSWLQGKGN